MLMTFEATVITLANSKPANAQAQTIAAQSARTNSTTIQIAPGRSSAISFNDGETISFILLSDSSRIVYTTNAAIESGRAKFIFLRQIQNLNIPGTTRSNLPNLFVTTIDRSSMQHQYEFNLQLVEKASTQTRIAIAPENDLDTSMGRANLGDIERGLQTLIISRQVDDRDPMVTAVRQCLKLARHNRSLSEASRITQVPIPVLEDLAELGLEASRK